MLLLSETLQNKFDEAFYADFPLLVSGGIEFVSGGKRAYSELEEYDHDFPVIYDVVIEESEVLISH